MGRHSVISFAHPGDLLSGHLIFAALLSLTFALVTVVYLWVADRAAARLTRTQMLLLHTLYLGWQTNVAFLSVIALHTVHSILQQQPLLLNAGWRMAPWMPASAAILYAAMLIFSLAFWWQSEKR